MKFINTRLQKLKILKRARQLLGENGEHWTKQKYTGMRVGAARKPGGAVYSTSVSYEKADSYCLVGAVQQAAREFGFMPFLSERSVSLYDLVTRETKFESVEDWNDASERTFPEIADVLDRRIAQLEQEK